MCASDYRARAREMLRGKWGMAVLVTLLAGMLGGFVYGSSFSFRFEIDQDLIGKLPQFLRVYLTAAFSVSGTLSIAAFIVGGTVRLGYCKYLLKLHDGDEGEVKDLFSEFDRFGEGFVLNLLTSLYIFLWTLLFIIPGIVAAYRYAMAPFILLENPGMKPREAIAASKEMMDGHKGELFILDLSFIGWGFLNLLTLGIGSLWLNPYMNASYAAFYRQISYPVAPAFDPDAPQIPWKQ